ATGILAVGRQAFEMVGRAPASIQVVRPMREGMIADFVVTEGMLHHLIGKVQGRQRLFKPEIMICVPSGVTSVERRAVTEAAIAAGARQAWLIDEPLAAAIGAGLPIEEAGGVLICDIGAGGTEIAIFSRSGTVDSRTLPVGGVHLDRAIATFLESRRGVRLDQRAAEALKLAAGAALPVEPPLVASVGEREVTSTELAAAMEAPLDRIAAEIGRVLEEAPGRL